ncbi:Eco57I restriction-modification methylase domain-containing protein [Psychroflexus salinarum]|uniref:site-specific DNA-methyltransferase (adenine-specific) n=1 Tax=Psychroflexus salinarum TaxID=546024 RepID=A0ABW3GPS8_9FLAO
MALFQSTVIKKYINAQDQSLLKEKWEAYKTHFHDPRIKENIRNAKKEQYQEGFLRVLFVKILGYTLNPATDYNLTTELKKVKDSKKADGGILSPSLSKGKGEKDVIGVIELKGTNTTDLSKIEAQAFGYKNNLSTCTYVITSNFEKIRFYIDNAIEHETFNLFELTEEDFSLLYLCLAYENIKRDIPKKIKNDSHNQEDITTKQLYKDYSVFKRELYNNLVELNPKYEPLLLFKKSQKLLDRFLFLFFAEDRHLLPPNSVRLILRQWKQLQELDAYTPLYKFFKKYFGYLNTGHKGKQYDVYPYNGGLFRPDEVLDKITIDDELLYKYTLRLSEYDFASEVDVNIIGHIFESSLNEIEEIQTQLEENPSEVKISKPKKDGVFYTPKYITKYIVENTIGKLCEEKKTEVNLVEEDYNIKRQTKTKKELLKKLNTYRDWLLQLTVVDPACGSGAFLGEALNYLIAEHQYLDELETKLMGGGFVFPNVENSILENNLFGVDINNESVEIAKLSLWIRTAQPNRKLNDLSNNIKCGNSLIDDPEVAGDKAFKWKKEFPQVFAKGGFDVVIGNPPYVRQELFKEIKPYLEKKYKSYNSVADLYTYFIEKGIDLINENGLFSFILPNKFLKATYGKNIRKVIIENANLELLVDFDDYPIFSDATTYPIIYVLNKRPYYGAKTFVYSKINKNDQTNDPISTLELKKQEIYISSLDSEGLWNFIPKKEFLLFEKLNKNLRLSEYVDEKAYLGIKTGKNDAFIIDDKTKSKIVDKDENSLKLIKKVATGKEIYRYRLIDSPKYMLFTQYDINIPEKFPSIFGWLKKFESDLKGRGDKGENWWNLRPCDNHKEIQKPKIIWRSITNECGFYLDREGDLLLTNNNNYFIANSTKGLIALLNSKVSFFILKNICTSPRGGFYDFRRDKVMTLPIPNNLNENEIHFEQKVDKILDYNLNKTDLINKFQRSLQRQFPVELEKLPKKLQDWYELSYANFIKELKKKKIQLSLSQEAEWEEYFLSEQQKANNLKSQIHQIDKEIDQMVYELYELTEEEIEMVENS